MTRSERVSQHVSRLEWEAPGATPLTDAESRADRSDIWTRNGNGPATS